MHLKITLYFQRTHLALLFYMKRLSNLSLYLPIVFTVLSMGLQWNSNGSSCPNAFEVREEQTLTLAVRAEALRKIPEIYNNEEARALIMDNIEIIRQWEATKDSFLPIRSTEHS